MSVRLGGLDQIIKRNIIIFPPQTSSEQFVIHGFHSFKYSLEAFPPKFYHEDSFPHKIPELRYSFLVAQYSAPQAGNRGFKSSVAHWGFREIKLSSFLTRLSRQKSLHKMHTNKEGFHRLIHHCTQGLDTSVHLFPMFRAKERSEPWSISLSYPSQLIGTCDANETTNQCTAWHQSCSSPVCFPKSNLKS